MVGLETCSIRRGVIGEIDLLRILVLLKIQVLLEIYGSATRFDTTAQPFAFQASLPGGIGRFGGMTQFVRFNRTSNHLLQSLQCILAILLLGSKPLRLDYQDALASNTLVIQGE